MTELDIERERREHIEWMVSDEQSLAKRNDMASLAEAISFNAWLAAKRSMQGSASQVENGWRTVIANIRKGVSDETPSGYDNSGYREYAGIVLDAVCDDLEALYTAPPAPVSAEPRPEEEAEEDAAVIHKLATILAGVCVALKGEELPLHRHSYHDIVEVAQAIKLELDLYRMQAASAPPSTDAKDSERYRWLRDVSVPPHNFYLSVPEEFKHDTYRPEQVDSYIDAAIAAKEA